MRMSRYKVSGAGVYYVRSALTDGLAGWTAGEREVFLAMVRKVGEFCGVLLLEGVVLEREVELLVRADPSRREELEDGELVRRYRVLYGEGVGLLGYDADRLAEVLAEGGDRARLVRRRLAGRMEDVSVYLQALKQRFTLWYNRQRERSGTIWKGRFASSLVEEQAEVLDYYRAFVRTAPVRAGLAERPEQWAWRLQVQEGRGPRISRELAALLRPVDQLVNFLLGMGLSPTGNYRKAMERRFWPDWVEQLSRPVIVGSDEFVAHHSRRWRGYDSSVPLRELAAEAPLRTARPFRRRRYRS